MKSSFKEFSAILVVFLGILVSQSHSFVQNVDLTMSRSNFKSCCLSGKEHSNSSNSCVDYSRLVDTTASCRFAFTICCSQNKRKNECERGKKHALANLPCNDLKMIIVMC